MDLKGHVHERTYLVLTQLLNLGEHECERLPMRRKTGSLYDGYGLRYAKLYFWFKIPALIAASVVPVFALAPGNGTKWITAGLGVLIAVLEGVQQVARYHDNWVAGIATRDQLELERALFLINAGVYAKPPEGQTSSSLLAERASVLMTQEQGQWLKSRQDAKQDVPGKK